MIDVTLPPITSAVMAKLSEVECALHVIPEAPSPDQLLRTEALAGLLAIAPRTLEGWRSAGKGPKATYIGAAVRYRYADVVDWIKVENEQ